MDGTKENPAQRLAAAVAELQTELNRLDRVAGADLEVGSAEDLQLLRLLLRAGPLRVGEIAKRRASSVTTASGRLDRLERKALIERERVVGDRRAVVAGLTPLGAQAARTSCEHRMHLLEGIADAYPPEGLERLVDAIAVSRSESHRQAVERTNGGA